MEAIQGLLNYQATKWVPLVSLQGNVTRIDAGVSIETLSGHKEKLERSLDAKELALALWDRKGMDQVIRDMAVECFESYLAEIAQEVIDASPVVEEISDFTEELHVEDLGLDEVSLQRDMDSGVR